MPPDAAPFARRLMTAASTHWPYLVVACPAMVLYLAYGYVQRLDYGPDEPYHLEYIHILAFEHRLPDEMETHVVQHGPVYYALMTIPYRLAGASSRPLAVPPGPDRLSAFSVTEIRTRRLLRVLQSLLAMLTLWVIYRVLCRLSDRAWLLVLPLALVGLNPVFAMAASVVNNDGLAHLWSALTCFLLVSFLAEGTHRPWRKAVAIGTCIGIGMAVKLTTMFVVPVAILAMYRQGGTRGRGLALASVLVAAAGVAGLWWPLVCYLRSGVPFPNFAVDTLMQTSIRTWVMLEPFSYGLGACCGFLRTTTAGALCPDFSWSSTGFVRKEVLEALFWLVIGGLTSAYLVPRVLPGGAPSEQDRVGVNGHLAVYSAVAMLALLMSIIIEAVWVDDRLGSGGRYLLSASPWFAIFCLGAMERLATVWRDRRWQNRAIVLAVVCLVAVNCWCLAHLASWHAQIG